MVRARRIASAVTIAGLCAFASTTFPACGSDDPSEGGGGSSSFGGGDGKVTVAGGRTIILVSHRWSTVRRQAHATALDALYGASGWSDLKTLLDATLDKLRKLVTPEAVRIDISALFSAPIAADTLEATLGAIRAEIEKALADARPVVLV